MANHPATPLKAPIWTLVLLNSADGLLTYWGLHAGVIEEANPLLSPLQPLTILLIKLLLSACLAAFLWTSLIQRQSRRWYYALSAVNVLYAGVLILHILWLAIAYL